jgi:hypothetical protein
MNGFEMEEIVSGAFEALDIQLCTIYKAKLVHLINTHKAWQPIRHSVSMGMSRVGETFDPERMSVADILDVCGIDMVVEVDGVRMGVDVTMNPAETQRKADKLNSRANAYALLGIQATVVLEVLAFIDATVDLRTQQRTLRDTVLTALTDAASTQAQGAVVVWNTMYSTRTRTKPTTTGKVIRLL